MTERTRAVVLWSIGVVVCVAIFGGLWILIDWLYVKPLPESSELLQADVAEMSRCITDARRAWVDATGKGLNSDAAYAPGIAAIAIKLYEVRNER